MTSKPAASRHGSLRHDPEIRYYLFYGPDESGSRALAVAIQAGIGREVERVTLSPAQLKAEPALLVDEATSGSLFGAARCIRVDGVGDECVPAVEGLIRWPVRGDPVILVGGALRKDARLVKLLGTDPAALVRASYPPDTAELSRLAIAEAQAAGLVIDRDLAGRLVDASNGDRAILTSEIAKLASYADATPDHPRSATDAMLDAIVADVGAPDLSGLLDAMLSGDIGRLDAAIAQAEGGMEAVAVIRAVQRRLLAMAGARAEMDRGATPRAAIDRLGHAIFWREKDGVAKSLPRWSARRLAIALDRCAALERTLKSSRGPGETAAASLYHALARSVRRHP